MRMSFSLRRIVSERIPPKTRSAVLNAGLRCAARISTFLLRQSAFPKTKTVLWTRIIKPYLAWRDIKMVARTTFGANLPCCAQDLVQSHILFFGKWEPNIGYFIARRLKRGSTFVDVGANIGYFSMLGAAVVGDTGKVISIEASPSIFKVLQSNLRHNSCANVHSVNIAVGRETGKMDILLAPGTNLGMTSTLHTRGFALETTVPADRLSNILDRDSERATLIKIDIEGAEPDVLMSILEDIGKYSKDLEIVTEITPSETAQFGATASFLIDAFLSAGFHAYGIENTYADYLATRPPQSPRRLRQVPSRTTDIVFSRIDADVL